MSATSILINVGAATAGAVRELNNVDKALDNTGTTASGWGGKLGGAGAIAAAGVAAVGAAALVGAKQLLDFGMAAVEDAQSVDRMNESLSKVPGITDAMIEANSGWVDSMQIATLYADTALRQSIVDLTLATGDLTKAQELTALAADLATTKNISLESATKILTKGVAGSTAKLEDWGLVVDTNKNGTIEYSEMVDGLTKSVGGAAEAAADTNPWERIQVIWDEIKEALGAYMIPLMEKLGDWFKNKENQQKLQDYIEKIAAFSEGMGKDAVKAIETFIKWLQSEEGKKALADWTQNLKTLAAILKSVEDWLNKNENAFKILAGAFTLMRAPYNLIKGWLEDLVSLLKTVWTWVDKVADALSGGRFRLPSWMTNLSAPTSMSAYSSGASAATMSSAAVSPRSTGVTYKVYVQGTGDPYNDARIIKRALEHEDKTQGRQPGQRLALSW